MIKRLFPYLTSSAFRGLPRSFVSSTYSDSSIANVNFLSDLLEKNQQWAAKKKLEHPDYFSNLAKVQCPEFLWIGCSDSRVPANQLLMMDPGEIFVHRNVANVVVHTDLNCLSVLQYAVDVLKVKHIIVCGHYGCGGVKAAMSDGKMGLIDNWLRNIKDIAHKNREELSMILHPEHKLNRMCELNVIAQVSNVCYTTIVQDAWKRKQDLTVHGWIYSLHDGLLKDLGLAVNSAEVLPNIYRMHEEAVKTTRHLHHFQFDPNEEQTHPHAHHSASHHQHHFHNSKQGFEASGKKTDDKKNDNNGDKKSTEETPHT